MHLADCQTCDKLIKNPDEGLFIDGLWFCSYVCHGRWIATRSDNIPA